ncbi:MAG: DUF262 domain-containing HNH endonuclease family protein [Desulfobacula sp.]|uniref:DUF262 domain-containing protein n=1 Tax=Desulfobacula sp. TaxID=2593537 RepID=UPI0025BF7C4A|nr:DUF262 domain-containing HNH endonuclease family protein [Desulfobacula sp.]MCD4718544.1 DUF262 domain-containing HNH endonuclease family protein [Desulfobacula sp.]
MKIESKDTDIESLLNGSFFHIPRFQRPYSWDAENISEFWDDLVINKNEDYFIGSMVVYKKAKQQFGVVDGQQRLTTITILLCVIRDEFKKIGNDDLAKGLHQLIERKDRNNQSEYVLKTETSFPYFQEHIQKFSKPEVETEINTEELNLENSHQMFKKYVASAMDSVDSDTTVPEDDRKELKNTKLVSIRNSVLNLNVIFVTLDNEDDAYLIFETLNTRGKDLALTDLVKNHFAKHIKARGDVDHAKLKWQQILEMIHNSSADISSDNFIYHFWASRYEAVPLKKLFPKIKKTIKKAKATGYLNSLLSDVKIYRSIYETSYDWNKNEREVSQTLWALQLFKLSQPVPAVLSLIRSYRNKIIKFGKLRDALLSIEKFHFIFTAVTSSRSSGGISAMYSSFARKLFKANDSQDASNEITILVDKLKAKNPSFEEFKVAFNEIYYTNSRSKQKKLVRYILRKLSEYYSYKYSVDFDDLTIEHVQPQSNIDEIWDEESIGKLGNLIFIDQEMNGKLGTKIFSEKMNLLKKEQYSIPEFLVAKTEWTPDDVNTHTDKMAEVAYKNIWKI